MRFVYNVMPQWPPLAWLAECSSCEGDVQVYHGERLETTEWWFCEAVWDGDFSAGNFDETDIVAGSGGRLRDDKLCFVSSGSHLDRLHTLEKDSLTYVSNSLVCLMSWLEADPVLSYFDYGVIFANYRYALFGEHTIKLPTTQGNVALTYFANLQWSEGRLCEFEKPSPERAFNCFNDYLVFMQVTMRRIADNARDQQRKKTYGILCPLSNGYDSPTIAVLAQAVGGLEAFSFSTDRDGNDDCGASIAAALGIPCHVLDRDSWRTITHAEVPFIACSGSVGDLALKSAEHLLGSSVLLTGVTGDTIWNKNAKLNKPMALGSGNLLGLCEYRLWTGFINLAVPLWGMNKMDDIVKLSNASEMQPWDMGGNYNRPICRRIVESAGIERSMFGVAKHGMSVVPEVRRDYLNPASYEDFFVWLKNQNDAGASKLPAPNIARLLDMVVSPLAVMWRVIEKTVRHRPRLKWMMPFINMVLSKLTDPYYHHNYVIHWAIDRAKRRY